MAITPRTPNGTTTVAYGTRTNTVVSRPSGMAAGDVALVGMTCGGSTLVQPTGPAGATLLGRVTYSAPDPWAVDLSLWLVPYSAGASWTFTHASRSTQAHALALIGVDATTPIDTAATSAFKNATGANQPVAPALTVATADAWLAIARGAWDGNAIAPPTGWTERYDAPVLWVGTREDQPTGDTGTVSVASGNGSVGSPWGIIMGAIRPAGTSTPPGEGSGSGAFAFSGSGSGKRTPKAAGGNSVAFAGSGVGTTARRGSGSGTVSIAGSGSGQTVRGGSGSGTVSISGSGTGRAARRGTGSGNLAWGGSGSGSAPVVGGAGGSGSGVVAYVGSGTGRRTPKASGTGAVAFVGAGSGAAPDVDQQSGTGSGSWAFTGSGAGKRSPVGSGSGAVTYTGAGAGVTQRSGSGSGSLAYVGDGFGVDPANIRDSARIFTTKVRAPATRGTVRGGDAHGTVRTPSAQGRLR